MPQRQQSSTPAPDTQTRIPRHPSLLCLQPPVAQLLTLAPLNLVALWFSDQDELRISAGFSLAAATMPLLGAQHSQKLGRALI